MDSSKTTAALKVIFDRNGPEILKNRSRFEAYLEDLIPSLREERLVLRHALDSSALWPLMNAQKITGEMIERAVKQLQQESHMREEDARFVVDCTAVARDETLQSVVARARELRRKTEPEKDGPDEERKRLEEEKRRLEEDQKRLNEEWSHLAELRRRQEELFRKQQEEEARRRQEEARKRQEEEARRRQDEAWKRQQEEARKRQEEEARKRQQEELRKRQEEARKRQEEEERKRQEEARRQAQQTFSCKLQSPKFFNGKVREGTLKAYRDRVVFAPATMEPSAEILYRDVVSIFPKTKEEHQRTTRGGGWLTLGLYGIFVVIFGLIGILDEGMLMTTIIAGGLLLVGVLILVSCYAKASKCLWTLCITTAQGKKNIFNVLSFQNEQTWRQAVAVIRQGEEEHNRRENAQRQAQQTFSCRLQSSKKFIDNVRDGTLKAYGDRVVFAPVTTGPSDEILYRDVASVVVKDRKEAQKSFKAAGWLIFSFIVMMALGFGSIEGWDSGATALVGGYCLMAFVLLISFYLFTAKCLWTIHITTLQGKRKIRNVLSFQNEQTWNQAAAVIHQGIQQYRGS